MGKVLAPPKMDKIVLKTQSDLWSGRFSFLLKTHYQREWKIVFSLHLLFYCSELEEEEKKNNGTEEKEKVKAEKFKRETVKVGISGHWSCSPIPFSLGQANPSVCTDYPNWKNVFRSSYMKIPSSGSVYS